ncbi:hypothetical protein RDWZM_004169 [Blomia tropicalis]|uniref:K Homology domain-containing protein n=1 Tax=Blomia tropicalis TaxID=40697 RepID=A0A9Q0RT92_BLOTA|nr:hypothetical protein RDWZM_004169 [Blomia tropicalis]
MNVLQTQSTTIKSELNQASAMTGGLGAFGVSTPSVTLTIRLIMQGKEVGSIIGKKGDNIKRFREESGAKITISDGSCPERIVTVTGSTDSILKAFALIAHKFEEVSNDPTNFTSMSHSQMNLTGNGQNGKSNCSIGSSGGSSPVSLKLIVPASQCGSLIGKGGSKIKEIRESTGASIQVASEMLPNSTERAVTLSGSADSITKSIYQICCVMLESPPKGPTIPYRPKPAMPPVFFAGGQAYTIQGQFAIPHPDNHHTNSQSQVNSSQSSGISTPHLTHTNSSPTSGVHLNSQTDSQGSPPHANGLSSANAVAAGFLDLTPNAAAAAAAQFATSPGFVSWVV